MMDVVLALDIGTSAVKGGLLVDGDLQAIASRHHETQRPRSGWVEQDPTDWWNGTIAVVRELVRDHPELVARTAAIGIVGQTPTQVLIDAALRPTGPAIVWQDQRAHAEAAWLRAEVGTRRLASWLGMGLPIDATYPPARLLWMKHHRPEQLSAAVACIQPKDYVVAHLTSVIAADAWCSKGLVQVDTGRADPDYLQMLGLDPDLVPPCHAPWDVAGTLTAGAAQATGLSAGLPVTVGWSDALAAMTASGAFADVGTGFVLSGTSDIVGVTASTTPADVRDLLVVPGSLTGGPSIVYGPTQSGGQSLDWLATSVLHTEVSAELIRQPRSSQAPLFLPYLQGERAPLWDPQARGAFLGLSSQHTAADLVFAVLEGVAFSNRHVQERAAAATGVTVQQSSLGGRPAQLTDWNQIRCDVLNHRLTVTHGEELSLVGAALLAQISQGVYPSIVEASRRHRSTPERVFEPEPSARDRHAVRYEAFRDASTALRPIDRLLAPVGQP